MRKAMFVLGTMLMAVLTVGSMEQGATCELWRSWEAEYHVVKLRVVQRRYGHSPQSRAALRELYEVLR